MKKLFFLLILVFSYMLIRIDDCQAQALVRYAKNGNIDKVQELLNKGADTITLNDALWWAAGEGYIDIMKLLIEKGANVNYLSKKAYDLNKNHISVIGLATALGQFESIKFLLEHGADPNAGSCVICHAFSHYYDLTRGNTSTIEINNLIKTLKLLLDNGANPDKEYPILTAIRMNMIDVINLLIEHGADLKKPACLYIACFWALRVMTDPYPEYGGTYQSYIETAKYLYRLGAKFPEGKVLLIVGDYLSLHNIIVSPDSVAIKDFLTYNYDYIIPGNYSIELDYRKETYIYQGGPKFMTYSKTPIKVDFYAKPNCAYLISAWTTGSILQVDEIDFNSNENEFKIKIN